MRVMIFMHRACHMCVTAAGSAPGLVVDERGRLESALVCGSSGLDEVDKFLERLTRARTHS